MPTSKPPVFRDRAKAVVKSAPKNPTKSRSKDRAKMIAKRPVKKFEDGGEVKIPMFNIIDRRTGKIVGTALTLKGAKRSVDRRDNEYGGYRFGVQRIGSDVIL